MLVGRIGLGVAALALAGRFVMQTSRTPSTAAIPTETPMFAVVVTGTALLVGGLTFLPVLALGPIVEQLIMTSAP